MCENILSFAGGNIFSAAAVILEVSLIIIQRGQTCAVTADLGG